MDAAKRRWEDQHWFFRGFQSAVFLYAQCGPCLAWRDNRRQKKQYKREKKERARDSDHPNILRQPAPHEVNPHWEEEIRLGPEPPKRGRKRGNTKASRDTTSSGTLVASDTAGSSMSDLAPENKDKAVFWNSRRYQRADEEFTYLDAVNRKQEMVYAPRGMQGHGSSGGVSGWTVDGDRMPEKPKKVYTPSSNMAPVNELHPPVVSSVPARRDERAWMKAPPPSVAFMHGKKGVTTRSRSGSGNSSLKNLDENLGRQVGQKLVEEKIRNAEDTKDPEETIPPSDRMDSELQEEDVAEPSTRQRSNSTSPFRLAREKQPSPTMKPRRRPAPLRLHTDKSSKSTSTQNASDAESEASSISHTSLAERGRTRKSYQSMTKPRMAARSALNSHPITPNSANQTVTTTSMVSPGLSPSSTLRAQKDSANQTPLSSTSPQPVDTYTPSPRKRKDTKVSADGEPAGPLLVKDSSLHVLQDVVDTDALMNSNWIRSPVVEARIPLPAPVGDSPRKENESPLTFASVSAKEQILAEGARRWSLGL